MSVTDESPAYRAPDLVERLAALRAEHARLAEQLAALERVERARTRPLVTGFVLGALPVIVLPIAWTGYAIYEASKIERRVDPHHTACPGVGEVDTESDTTHCGGCGHRCERSDQVCRVGVCTCPEPLRECGGACRDLETDSANCGSCANACAPGIACVAGQCHCGPGLSSCFARDGLTHCVDHDEDENHCGGCRHPCANGATCTGGSCACDDTRLVHCWSNRENAAFCANVSSDRDNCGACNHYCRSGEMCVAGTCIADTP